jgi:opacity protein-like surface antigen
MVRALVVVLALLFLALPAAAQDDFPRIEMSMGYANVGLPCCSGTIGESSRHSGFSTTQGFNLTRVLGVENYFGYYGLGGKNTLGTNVSLITNLFGAKLAARTERAVPYFVAGIGLGYLTDEVSFGQSSLAARIGPGVDIKMNESMAFKVDFTRLSLHQRFSETGGGWSTGWNLSTGIVFTLSN